MPIHFKLSTVRNACVAAFVLTGLAFALSATGRAAETLRVGVSVPAAVAFVPLQVGIDTGIFAKHGLDVTLTPIQNLSLLPGTVGRQFEFAASTPTDLIKAVAAGLDVVASAGEAIEAKSNPTTHVIVRKDSGITSAADLKGKAIAAPTVGAVIHVATLYWLKKNGVDPASIRAVEVPFPNMGDQLRPAMSMRSRRWSRSRSTRTPRWGSARARSPRSSSPSSPR